MTDIKAVEKKYLLCIMDVLGFEYLFFKYGMTYIAEKYNEIIQSAQKEKITGLRFGSMNGETYFTYISDFSYFSDTIVFWSDYNSQNFVFLIRQLQEVLCRSIEIGIPLRGAISVGNLIIKKKSGIYLGQPIISAARAEKSQKWIGITFSKEFSQPPFCNDLIFENVLQYEKQIKDKCKDKVSPFVIDFPRHWELTRDSSIENAIQNLNTDSEHSMYYQNTLDFVNFSKDNHNRGIIHSV